MKRVAPANPAMKPMLTGWGSNPLATMYSLPAFAAVSKSAGAAVASPAAFPLLYRQTVSIVFTQ